MTNPFSSTKLAEIGAAHSAIQSGITTHDSTPGEPAKFELAQQQLQPLLRANLGLFKQIAPAFIQQTKSAFSDAISPWISDAPTRDKIINDHGGIREIELAIASVERSVYDPSSAIAGLRNMDRVFSALLSAPQNQP
jgi:hypothetical protein